MAENILADKCRFIKDCVYNHQTKWCRLVAGYAKCGCRQLVRGTESNYVVDSEGVIHYT